MILKIESKEDKQNIAKHLLESLTDWFGIKEARDNYIITCALLPLFASYDKDIPTGFIALQETSKHMIDIYVMGVAKTHQRSGLGRRLLMTAEDYAREEGYKLIQVKTVAFGHDENYDKTNLFYRSLGFYELEVFKTLWDEHNPCLILVKPL